MQSNYWSKRETWKTGLTVGDFIRATSAMEKQMASDRWKAPLEKIGQKLCTPQAVFDFIMGKHKRGGFEEQPEPEPDPPSPDPPDDPAKWCANCDRVGHFAKDCPYRDESPSPVNPVMEIEKEDKESSPVAEPPKPQPVDLVAQAAQRRRQTLNDIDKAVEDAAEEAIERVRASQRDGIKRAMMEKYEAMICPKDSCSQQSTCEFEDGFSGPVCKRCGLNKVAVFRWMRSFKEEVDV